MEMPPKGAEKCPDAYYGVMRMYFRMGHEAFMAERQRDSLVAVLARLFDWEDKTYAHAVMHVENAVGNLRADCAAAWRDGRG